MAQITDLPIEVLVHIFKFYMRLENQAEFFKIIPKVSKQFKKGSESILVWQKFDGTLPINFLLQLCRDGRLICTEELTMSRVVNLSHRNSLNLIFTAVPNLKAIDFSNVKVLTKDVFTHIEKCDLKIAKLKFSSYCEQSNYVITLPLLDDFLKAQGKYLMVIDLSYSMIRNMKTLLTEIALSCPNLEQLLMHNLRQSTKSFFPLKLFQFKCTKLRVLSLEFLIDISGTNPFEFSGFPNLETFQFNNIHKRIFTDRHLVCVLSKSRLLKSLILTNCDCLNPQVLRMIPASGLRCLSVPLKKIFEKELFALPIFKRWSTSLRVLDLSSLRSNKLNITFSILAKYMIMPDLEWLDLSDTNIQLGTLIRILVVYCKLAYLNLTYCFCISPDKMKKYCGRDEVVDLYRSINTEFNGSLPPIRSGNPSSENESKFDGPLWKFKCVNSELIEIDPRFMVVDGKNIKSYNSLSK